MCRLERNTLRRARPLAARFTERRTRPSRRVLVFDCIVAALLLLAFLAEDVFVGILDALALVRLGLAVGADLRGDLSDLLAVHAGDHDLRRLRHGDRDAFR